MPLDTHHPKTTAELIQSLLATVLADGSAPYPHTQSLQKLLRNEEYDRAQGINLASKFPRSRAGQAHV